MSTETTRNTELSRYEIRVDGVLAGFAGYRLRGDVAVFPHTEIATAFEGRGLGTELILAALADVRSRGWTVDPVCPFVGAVIDRHPELRDLVGPSGRPAR